MNNMRGYEAAQREWENREPPEDGPSECPDCNGSGHEPSDEDLAGEDPCCTCEGAGWLDANGLPFYQDDREADEYADMKRDEGLTSYRGGFDPEDDE